MKRYCMHVHGVVGGNVVLKPVEDKIGAWVRHEDAQAEVEPLRDALGSCVYGMAIWANDEDGVHYEAWDAYVHAKRLLQWAFSGETDSDGKSLAEAKTPKWIELRNENKALRELLREQLRRMEMNANDRFEELAAQFYRDTGYMAPGKDAPAALGDNYKVRSAKWTAWCVEQNAALVERIRKALEGGT